MASEECNIIYQTNKQQNPLFWFPYEPHEVEREKNPILQKLP